MKTLLKPIACALIVVAISAFASCTRQNVQDGPAVEDTTNATNAADNTMNADTVNRGDTTGRDTTRRNDTIPRP